MIEPTVVLKRTAGARVSKSIYAGKSMLPADERMHLTGQTFSVALYAPAGFDFVALAANDVIVVQYWDGGAWRDVVIEGDVLQLDADNTIRTVYGPGVFRLSKAVSDHSIGAVL